MPASLEKRWTAEEVQTAVRLWPDHSAAEIARIVGKTRNAVLAKMDRLYGPRLRAPSRYFELHKDEIIAAYQNGQATAQIAETMGCLPNTVRRAFEWWGVPLRDDRRVDPQEVARMVEMRRNGDTLMKIALEFGLSESGVCRRMKRVESTRT